jgi:hypothetical protein
MGANGITVKEAIEMLSNIDNKEMTMLIDCPYCGKGNQISFISECVVLGSQEPESEQEMERRLR